MIDLKCNYSSQYLEKPLLLNKEVNIMKKEDLIKLVIHQARITKKDATTAVDTVFEAIAEALEMGEEVKISRFGTFKVRKIDSYERKSIRDVNQTIVIPSKLRPSFRPSSSLTNKVNHEDEE